MPHPAGRLMIFILIFGKRQTEAVFSHGKDQAAQAEAALESTDSFCLVRRRRKIIPAPGLYGDKRTAAIHAGGHVDGRRTRLFDPIQKSQQRIGKTAGGDMHERNVFQGRER